MGSSADSESAFICLIHPLPFVSLLISASRLTAEKWFQTHATDKRGVYECKDTCVTYEKYAHMLLKAKTILSHPDG